MTHTTLGGSLPSLPLLFMSKETGLVLFVQVIKALNGKIIEQEIRLQGVFLVYC
jgi:hypothetical protein